MSKVFKKGQDKASVRKEKPNDSNRSNDLEIDRNQAILKSIRGDSSSTDIQGVRIEDLGVGNGVRLGSVFSDDMPIKDSFSSASVGFKRNISDTRVAEESASKKHHYAIATTDTAFKHMLSVEDGDKEIMRSFLQAFVPSFQIDPILTIEPCPVAIPVLREKGEKQTFMDLHVRTQNGTHYIIEMQAKRHIMFDERALYYACATYAHQLTTAQLKEEHWYHDLKPVIAIQVLDYDSNRAQGLKLPEGVKVDALIERVKERPMPADQYIKHYTLTDQYSQQAIDYLQMIQVELPRAKPVLKTKKKITLNLAMPSGGLNCYVFPLTIRMKSLVS